MYSLLRRHARTILVGHGTVIALLTTSMMVGIPKAVLYISPTQENLRLGESMTLVVNLNAKIPVNAIGVTLVIPPEIEVVAISKEGSFIDLWTEETILRETAGELRFSGGSLERGGLTGVHTALTLTVRAKSPGEAVFSFKDTEVRAHDGIGDLVSTELRTLSISIAEDMPHGTIGETAHATRAVNADFDGNGAVTIADLSILMLRIFGTYDARFDLNQDGLLSLADLSIFLNALQGR